MMDRVDHCSCGEDLNNMASWDADKLKDKFLTCAICNCLYDDPATLQCGHSYCRKCLTSFIQSKPDSVRNEVIPCSMRCEGARVPDPQKHVETWATQIKTSLVIRNLLNDYKHMTDQPKTVDVHTQRFFQCEDHRGKLQELICEDHRKAICMICWGDKHLHCMSVVPLETKVEQIQPDTVDCTSKVNPGNYYRMVRIAKFRSDVDTLGSIEKDTQSKIQHIFKTIVDIIEEKESPLLQKLKTNIKSEIQNRQKIIQSEKSKVQVYQQRSRLIEKAEQSGLLSDMYNIYQAYLSPEASGGEIDISQSTYRAIRDVVYSVNTDQLIESINKLDFGTIDIKYEVVNDSPVSSPSAACCSSRRFPVLTDTVQCTLADDIKGPLLLDVTVLDVDGIQVIVVTDCDNNCVKSFYTSNNKTCHSKLHLDNYPCGITQWKDHQVMVTVPGSYKILTVAVTPDLVLLSTISTSRMYCSLAVLGPSRFAAGRTCSRRRQCVDILNMEGEVMKSVSKHNIMELFSYPWYMSVNNKGNLLVSDGEKKTVTCLTSGGKFMWTYALTVDQYPTGIQWTPDGIVLVDCDSHKVILLTESGQYVRNVLTQLDGLPYPRGIYVHKNNSLFVCCGSNVKHFVFTGTK